MDFLFKRATLSLILYCQVKPGNRSKTLFTGDSGRPLQW